MVFLLTLLQQKTPFGMAKDTMAAKPLVLYESDDLGFYGF
ncbi:MAG: hypothetical protein CM1200mP13_03780 [Candidatus Pelagibacterales bacterium]|nr:MAG: hypothetical protein CM1200mP13_03780 [Pelagibacterales bacterium]